MRSSEMQSPRPAADGERANLQGVQEQSTVPTVRLALGRNPCENGTPVVNEEIGLSDLSARLTRHETRTNKLGPYFCAPMRDGRRNAGNALPWRLFALDFDGKTGPTPDPELSQAFFRDIWHCGYTTHSYTPNNGKHRVVLLLSRAIDAAEYRQLHNALAEVLPFAPDPKLNHPDQPVFLPSCPPGATPVAWFNDGRPLDVDALLAEHRSKTEAESRAQAAYKAPAGKDSVIAAFNAAHDLAEILERHGYVRRGRKYLHPQSESGIPSVNILANGDLCFSHSSSDPLGDDQAHDAFDVFRILDHHSETRAAVKAAATVLGLADGSAKTEIPIPASSFEKSDLLESLAGKLADDPQYPFREDVLRVLVALETADLHRFNVAKAEFKAAGVVVRDLSSALAFMRKRVKGEQAAARKAKPADEQGAHQRIGQYEVLRGSIHRWKETHDGEVPVRLSNFDARIVREVMRDDGAQVDSFFSIVGTARDGRPLGATDVPFAEFSSLAWVTKAWGNLACIEAGQSNRDHLRAAIQTLSGEVPRRTVFAHTGWRQLEGGWHYLHAHGGLGPDGGRDDIEVDAGAGHMRHYALPAAGTVDDIRASLDLLAISPDRPDIGATLLAAIFRAPLAACVPIDVSLFLGGPTGAFKSELSGLVLQHFGQGFSARALPGNWSDTITDLELKAHAAKDAVFAVDDFKPNGRTRAEADRLHSMADRLFRNVGNGAGRGRRLANLKQRPDYPARGLVLASGEDLPKGQSCRARMVILDIRRGDVDKERLTALQRQGRTGAFSRAMAAYVAWLAPQLDDLKISLRDELLAERDQAIQAGLSGHHDRVPDNVAQLLVGAKLLCRFAGATGAVRDADAMLDHLRKAIYRLAEAQGEHLQDQDEITRFFALLGSVLSSKRAHVLDINTLNAPKGYDAWGWQEAYDTAGNAYAKPQGRQIGWLDGASKLYLDPNTAFAEVAKLAQEQGESFSISPNTLWKRLGERGLLLDRKEDKRTDGTPYLRNHSRRTIGGRRYGNLVCVGLFENPQEGGAENLRTNRTNPLEAAPDVASSWSADETVADQWSEKADQENACGPHCGPAETQQPSGFQGDWSDWSANNSMPYATGFEINPHTPAAGSWGEV